MFQLIRMKKLLILLLMNIPFLTYAQEVADTTIYKFVDEVPRFPGCEQLDTTIDVKMQCAQTNLLMFFNRNIVYPLVARDENIEGQVVISFVVEKDGLISNPAVMKDIGGGCGDEAIRVANGMNQALIEAKLRWRPGMKAGKPVRTQISVPIKFKLQDPPDFVLIDNRDSLFVVVDDSLSYRGGTGELESFLKQHLRTPVRYADSCKVGSVDLTILARPNGYVRVVDLVDYWNLGIEFQWEAIKTATATWGNWIPATRKGRAVPSSYDMTLTFLPETPGCKQEVQKYNQANQLAEEGSSLFNEGKQQEGIDKLSSAIQLFPENANFLYLRGQAYMNMEKMEEACADFRKVKTIVSIGMVDQLLPLICK